MKKHPINPRGRFVRAHIRRSQTNPRDYFNVTDYQEKVDRFRANLKKLAALQLKFQFFTPEQPEQEIPDSHNPTDPKDDSHLSK
jgi:hypothetical protein